MSLIVYYWSKHVFSVSFIAYSNMFCFGLEHPIQGFWKIEDAETLISYCIGFYQGNDRKCAKRVALCHILTWWPSGEPSEQAGRVVNCLWSSSRIWICKYYFSLGRRDIPQWSGCGDIPLHGMGSGNDGVLVWLQEVGRSLGRHEWAVVGIASIGNKILYACQYFYTDGWPVLTEGVSIKHAGVGLV